MSAALRMVASRLVAGLARTWGLEVAGDETVQRLRAAGAPLIFAVWHGHLLAPLWHRRDEGITLLVSAHRDAAYLATAARRWGYHVARGSTTRGGAAALRAVLRALAEGGDAAFTPDGPRGPAGVIKPGVVAASQHAGAAIVPVGVAASRVWRLESWDRFVVPRPYARVRIVYGEPLRVAPGPAGRREARRQLEQRLGAARERACAS